MMLDMGRGMKSFKMDAFIKVYILMARFKGLASICGRMGRFMRENGSITRNMELECGRMKKETAI